MRPSLSVPLPAVAKWRFPLPSPPIVTISPEIPTEAFHTEVENPIISRDAESDVDEIDEDLSPTSSVSSNPSTPPREKEDKSAIEVLSESSSGDVWLERTESRVSISSKETVRLGYSEERMRK